MRDQDDSPVRERWDGDCDYVDEDGMEESRKATKRRSKERSKSSRREEKDHRSRDRERLKTTDGTKDREKDSKGYKDKKIEDRDDRNRDRNKDKDKRIQDRDDRERDWNKDKTKDKDIDQEKYRVKERESIRDHKDQGKKERERERETEKDSARGYDEERGKEKNRDREKDRKKVKDSGKETTKEKERERHKDREKERDNGRESRDWPDRERGKDRSREEGEIEQIKERSSERDKPSRKQRDEDRNWNKDLEKDGSSKLDREDGHYRDMTNQETGPPRNENGHGATKSEEIVEDRPGTTHPSVSEIEKRISKMKGERLKKKTEGASEVVAWVSRIRRIEDKRNAQKDKALQLSKMFEEQDNAIDGDREDESATQHTAQDLAGVKILHGLDKVIEGGAVVLTLKDQSILADGDINQEMDMLENVEIGEQKRRTEAYQAAKRKPGINDDKFNDESGSVKKLLPQYDDPVVDEGVTLDASGRFSGVAEQKLEELRRKIEGVPTTNNFEDLNSSGKISSDYYTQEEMLQFKKPRKKKSLRKKEKLDVDALEAEARSSGLGAGDHGSRNDGKRQTVREELEKSEAEKRNVAYQSALSKADEASKVLRLEQSYPLQREEDDPPVFDDDDDDLQKSLERARKLALKKQDDGAASGPQAIALIASSNNKGSAVDDDKPANGESQEIKVVFTEMEEFVWGLNLDEEAQKPDGEDVFMEEDVAPKDSNQEPTEEDDEDTTKDDTMMNQDDEIVPVEAIHEVPVGKGLSGVLQLLKDRGTLKESVEWGGRNMDKKKSKLVGISEDNGEKEIRIERTDEYGRILTPKEAFRKISHKFHGKGPGKMKQEKRMRQYQEELKVKQMKNADTPSLSVERMREAQAQLKTPYLVLSGHVKPGQTSDPRSGFATVEKDFAGGLTPMLGDKKVEHFLGIQRKPEPAETTPTKKPKI